MKKFATFALTVFLLLASAKGASAGFGTLAGTVTIGPLTPVCMVGVPCYRYDETIIIKRVGFPHMRLTTQSDPQTGEFSIDLFPGRYTLRFPDYPLCPTGVIHQIGCFGPHKVVIRPGQTTFVNIGVDTGIH